MAPSVISSLLLVHPLEVTWFPSPIKERLGRTVSSQDHERAHARGHRIRELLYALAQRGRQAYLFLAQLPDALDLLFLWGSEVLRDRADLRLHKLGIVQAREDLGREPGVLGFEIAPLEVAFDTPESYLGSARCAKTRAIRA